MSESALEKLRVVVRAKAAWFQSMEGDHLVPTQHAGLSPEFLRAIGQVGTGEMQACVLQSRNNENRAAVMKLSEMSEPERVQLRKHGIHHVVVVPVLGKKSAIGMLPLGSSGSRRPTL